MDIADVVEKHPDLFQALAAWIEKEGFGYFEIHMAHGQVKGWTIKRYFRVEEHGQVPTDE